MGRVVGTGRDHRPHCQAGVAVREPRPRRLLRPVVAATGQEPWNPGHLVSHVPAFAVALPHWGSSVRGSPHQLLFDLV